MPLAGKASTEAEPVGSPRPIAATGPTSGAADPCRRFEQARTGMYGNVRIIPRLAREFIVGSDWTLPAEPKSAAVARRSLVALQETLPPGRLEDLRLIVSELLTNAVVHSGLTIGDWIRLTVDVLPGLVRVEVTDAGNGFAEEARRRSPGAPEIAEHGYGLVIVERLALRWGIERDHETMVWAEIPIERATQAHYATPQATPTTRP